MVVLWRRYIPFYIALSVLLLTLTLTPAFSHAGMQPVAASLSASSHSALVLTGDAGIEGLCVGSAATCVGGD